jgi:hypothetical protein
MYQLTRCINVLRIPERNTESEIRPKAQKGQIRKLLLLRLTLLILRMREVKVANTFRIGFMHYELTWRRKNGRQGYR